MTQFKYLIIGGGIAGTTAAEAIRKKDPDGSVAVVSDEPYRLYSRIMLSKPGFFLGRVPEEQIWLKRDEWYSDNKIELIKGKKATTLNTEKKIVTLNDGATIGYSKLLLAIGACARPWKVEGCEKCGIYSLRTLDDAKTIIKALGSTKNTLTIGGGFISFEMANLLKAAGKDVTVILRESYFWEPVLDETSGKIIEAALEKGGVKIKRNSEVQKISGEEAVKSVLLKDGSEIPCDMIISGIGVVCESQWLQAAGIATNRGILADEFLQTNIPDIYTAGDVAEYNDLILEERVQLGNWVNAQEQGRVAGLNMAGEKTPFKMVSFYTTKGFNTTIGFVGDIRTGEGRQIINRGLPETDSRVRLIATNDELVGATLINRAEELRPIVQIIEKNIKISDKLNELSDTNFDLRSLISQTSLS